MNSSEKLQPPHRCTKPGEPREKHHQRPPAATLQDVGQKRRSTFSSFAMARRHNGSAPFLGLTKQPPAVLSEQEETISSHAG